jgi:glutamyl-tRNA synthetase
MERARAVGGTLILRSEDLDRSRVRPEFVAAMIEDLRWYGLEWEEGPDLGGPVGPYAQSERLTLYRSAFDRLRDAGFLYPCTCTRKDIRNAIAAPHAGDEEPIYPGTCRPVSGVPPTTPDTRAAWRFRVPDGEVVAFEDGRCGPQRFTAGRDFGDFVVWRHDDVPAYQLAVVADDIAMGITEVVRGEDLLLSTARQLLIYRALGATPPAFYHCELVRDERGERLAKRHDALSLRALRQQGQFQGSKGKLQTSNGGAQSADSNPHG